MKMNEIRPDRFRLKQCFLTAAGVAGVVGILGLSAWSFVSRRNESRDTQQRQDITEMIRGKFAGHLQRVKSYPAGSWGERATLHDVCARLQDIGSDEVRVAAREIVRQELEKLDGERLARLPCTPNYSNP